MKAKIRSYETEGFCIRVLSEWDFPDFTGCLTRLANLEKFAQAKILQNGRHQVIRANMPCNAIPRELVVKRYGRQAAWRDFIAKRGKGSKASRAFETAVLLREKGVSTPCPVAIVERWSGNRLEESYFICEFIPALSDFREELKIVLQQTRDCEALMALIEQVAVDVRKFHDAGVIHRDLGNQNIGLQKQADGSWKSFFIDLNRAQIFPKLSEKQRGKDLARLDIPSAIFSEFLAIYRASPECRKHEKRERMLFGLHSKIRPLRHPFREYRIHGRLFPSAAAIKSARRNLWIWDERSAQAIPAFTSKERRGLRPAGNILSSLYEWLKHGFSVRKAYREINALSFSEPLSIPDSVGMALDPNPATWSTQIKWLNELQGELRLPILLRIYHHKGDEHWKWTIERGRELHAGGHPVAFALVQDRNAVLRPKSWEKMTDTVITQTQDFSDFYEIGHVTNRGKWGIWDFREYPALLAPALKQKKTFPHITLSGPACIDFDLHSLPSLLGKIRQGDLDCLSQHLYVDRRGAPENKQGKFDTVDKCALHRAFARVYGLKQEKIIISEVNWPVVGTGHWSPVGSPYTINGPWATPPSATEEDYAKFMCRYFLLAIASGHVSRVYWWRLAARGYGIIDDTGTPKQWRPRPAFFALKKLLSQLADSRFEQRLTNLPAGTYALEFSRADGSRFVLRWTLDSFPEIANA